MCDCCNSQIEHDNWMKNEMKYWAAYFGNAVRNSIESERALKEDGLSIDDQNQIQVKLK